MIEQRLKAKGLVRALPKASQCWVRLGPRQPVWPTTSGRPAHPIDMVKKAVCQMKASKAPGPSGIVVEMIWAAGDIGASMIHDLTAAIIRDGKVPSDWEQSFIVCLYKGKGDALERGNYHSLKLTEQVMKVQERIVDCLMRQLVSIDDSQFGFVPGRGTTDAIFAVRQLQEKYLAANKRLHGFCGPGEGIWPSAIWMSSGGCWENLVWKSGLYDWCRGCAYVLVGEGYSEEFEVKVSVHQGSVLSPLLFIIVLEALSCEFRSGVPWEDLYADDLVIIAESLEECVRRLLTWKEAMEEKGLKVNAGKQRSWSVVRAWTSCRVQASFHAPSVALEWAATASSATAASTGCTRNAVGSSTCQRTLITNVHSARELHTPWTAGHRGKSKPDLTSWRW